MFGKKKLPGVPVQHYEGLDFPIDFPCRIELTEKAFTIVSLKPETTVTLPIAQIKSFSAMEEESYMLKYHGQAKSTSKTGFKKYYLIVEYISKSGEEKRLAFWGTSSEYGKFIEMQNSNLNQGSNYSL